VHDTDCPAIERHQMIGYITLGSDDPHGAAPFYDAVFGALGGTRSHTTETLAAWDFGPLRPQVMLTVPFEGAAASGNGSMVALMAPDPETVDRVHALALNQGAADEGAPGPRGPDFYAGYFRTPDGHKMNLFAVG